jgi:catechol 2,3-dioxygenase-like lactoylglutathione lyase family enzyme
MIDHISIGVRDLAAGARFYDTVLAPLGYARMIVRETTIGYGKQYPDFWLNERRAMAPVDPNTGTHICLRASSPEAVKAVYDAAMNAGATSDGPPGPRPEYTEGYFAAFIRDPDGNKIEAVTFIKKVN